MTDARDVIASVLSGPGINRIDLGMDADVIITRLHAAGHCIVATGTVSRLSAAESALRADLNDALRKVEALERVLISSAVISGELGKMLLRGDET